jgi:hypothetical protein
MEKKDDLTQKGIYTAKRVSLEEAPKGDASSLGKEGY